MAETIDVCLHLPNAGDVVVAALAACGLAEENPDKLVRLVVKTRVIVWAEMVWKHCVPHETYIDGPQTRYIRTRDVFPKDSDTPTRQEFIANLLGTKPKLVEVSVSEHALAKAASRVSQVPGKGPTVLLNPTAKETARMWPIYRWKELELRLLSVGCRVLTDVSTVPMFAQYFKYPLQDVSPLEIISIVSLVDASVCNDSGIAHYAGVLGKPCVAVCGMFHGERVFSWYKTVQTVQATMACSPCFRSADVSFKPYCIGGCEALADVSASVVFDKLAVMLKLNRESSLTPSYNKINDVGNMAQS